LELLAYFGIPAKIRQEFQYKKQNKEGRANRLILELLAYFGIPATIRK
jgi:hypothetical protein